MAKQSRPYSKEFVEYQKFIVAHPAYEGMPMPEVMKESVPWVSPAKGALGMLRTHWWEKKKERLVTAGVLKTDAKISDVARAIHPTKFKPCQTCGKSLSIEYIYLNTNGLRKIQDNFAAINVDEFTSIGDVLKLIDSVYQSDGLQKFIRLFDLGINEPRVDLIETAFKKDKQTLLSPGVMSNAPDRFDGFHSYNKCCRAKEDTGRSKENLSKYGEDRRAYENWADGDWKAASWLMKEFAKHGVSADHIGPISLGFCHTPFFAPMTKQENSAKNNRIRYEDVIRLIELESQGHQIISWHTKPVWDRLKLEIKNDDDALQLSKVLRKHLHRVLLVLNELKERGNGEFLDSLLNPEYANFSIKVIGFDPLTGSYERLEKTPGNKVQYSRNAQRYSRIAYESLAQYKSKDNRRLADIDESSLALLVARTESAIKQAGNEGAKLVLQKALGELSIELPE